MKHLLYFVLTNPSGDDYTNHGLSSRVEAALLFWDCSREEAIDYCKQHNIRPEDQFFLVKRMLWEENHDYAEPLIKPEDKAQSFGGNWLHTSHSAGYNQGYCRTPFPIPIHDRFDTWEDFHRLGN